MALPKRFPKTNAYVGSGTPVVSKHPIRVPVPPQKQTPPKKLPRATPAGVGGLGAAAARLGVHLNFPSIAAHVRPPAPPPRSSTPTMTGTGHTALTPHPLSTNPTPGAAGPLPQHVVPSLQPVFRTPAPVTGPPAPGGTRGVPPVTTAGTGSHGVPVRGVPPQAQVLQSPDGTLVDSTGKPVPVPADPYTVGPVPTGYYNAPPAKRDFRDMLQEELDAAYGGVDQAESSAAASAKSFNKSLLSANLGSLVGNKAYASLLGSVLKEQAKSAQSFADSRRKIAEHTPDYYNKLQAQTAAQDAQDAKLDFDYYKTNMGHSEWQSEFGLKVDKQGFDQQLDTAKFGLDVKKLGSTVAIAGAKLKQTAAYQAASLQQKAAMARLVSIDKRWAIAVASGDKNAIAQLNAQTRLGTTQATIGARLTIADQGNVNKVTTTLLRQGMNPDGTVNQNSPVWATINQRNQASVRSYNAAIARVGASDRKTQESLLAATLRGSKKTLTPKQKLDAHGTIWDSMKDNLTGIRPNPVYNKTTGQYDPQKGWAHPPQNYNAAIADLIGRGYNPQWVVASANKIYAPGQQGRPLHDKRNWKH